jgi:hypothetical protein
MLLGVAIGIYERFWMNGDKASAAARLTTPATVANVPSMSSEPDVREVALGISP